jgi:tetratricopeptide (TPR) repeat protein
MSPEQADMATEDIDTRSDVYSLGVLLYVLLTGVLPFDVKSLRDSGIDNVRKTIRETDPKTPSTRLTRLGEEAAKVAEMRSTEISTLAKHLKNELEWVPLKAMRKERSERYRSASELADDIENYLKGEPLIAGPPTSIYRLKKFVRRNNVLTAAVLAVAVTLTLGLAGTTAMYLRAERALDKEAYARAEAERFWAQAEAASNFLVKDVLGEEGFVEGPDSDPYHALDITAEKLQGKFVDEPLAEAIIREALGEKYFMEMDKAKLAIPHLKRAYQIRLQQLGPEHMQTIMSANTICWSYMKHGRYDDALRLWCEQLEIVQEVMGEEHHRAVFFMCRIGYTYTRIGKYKEAEEILTKALEINEHVLGWPYFLESGSKDLGQNYLAQGRYDKAAPLLQKVVESRILRLGETHQETQKAIKAIIRLYEAWNKPEKVEEWRAKLPQREDAEKQE